MKIKPYHDRNGNQEIIQDEEEEEDEEDGLGNHEELDKRAELKRKVKELFKAAKLLAKTSADILRSLSEAIYEALWRAWLHSVPL